MPAQIVKLEIATRDGYDVIADQRTAQATLHGWTTLRLANRRLVRRKL
jgi:hypothetical protein